MTYQGQPEVRKMSRTRITQTIATGSVLAMALSLAAPVAAEAPYNAVLSAGYGGPKTQDGGPGNEQPSSIAIEKGDDVYLVTVFMNSDVEEGYWQCKCSSMKLSATGEPEVVADEVQLTNNGGDRPCNHPMVATDGEYGVLTYGTDTNNANTQTYAGVIDEMCGWVAEPIKISNNNNNNEGAPDISYNGDGWFTAGYLSTGGNDRTYARGLRLNKEGGEVSLSKEYLENVVSPANIGRPAIVAASANRSLLCAAKGDQRPPEDGVECAWLNSMTGEVYWREYIAESDPGNKVYMNQPSVASLDFGQFAVQVVESTGEGKNKNNKGSSSQHLFVIEPTDSGMQIKAHLDDIGDYQTHPAICSGRYGDQGARATAVFDASITGIGQPGLQIVHYDASIKELDYSFNEQWVVAPWGDSGHLANKYGANPNTQGRDFLRCIGDVKNPGFGVADGFKPNVKTFFAAPIAGRMPGEEKNALIMSLIPGEVETPVAPEPPTSGSAGAGGSGSTGATSGAGGASSNNNDADDDAVNPPMLGAPEQASSCSYSSGSGDVGWFALLLGLGMLFVARREEV